MTSLCPRSRRALRLALVLCQFALVVPARARGESVVLLSPRGDEALTRERDEAQRVLQRALQGQGVTVMTRAEVASGADGAVVEPCDALDCAAAFVHAAGADLAVAVSVWSSGDPPSPSVLVTLVDARGDRFPGRARLEGRGRGDLARAVKDALLDARALQLLGPGPWLRVHGEPAGAEVVLNGKRVGTVPYRAPVESGRHTLQVRAGGHRAHVQTVDVPASAARQIDVQVELPPRTGEDSREANAAAAEALAGEPEAGGERPIVGPLVVGGLGLAVIAADIALVLGSGCQREDSRGTCLTHRSIRKAPALAIGGVGFAAIAAAALWHVLGGDSGAPERDTALRLTPDGAALTATF